MGAKGRVTVCIGDRGRPTPAATAPPRRGRPRDFVEWRTLKRWGKLPVQEEQVPGYLLREARLTAGLTQSALALILCISQQAVAQAERWTSNPTLAFCRLWADACGCSMLLEFSPNQTAPGRSGRR